MREILFRAKRKDNSEWVEGWLLKDEVTGQYFIHASGNSVNESDKVNEEGCLCFVAFEVDEHTICQYTGLTDKNGNKIWENDIIGTDVGNVKVAYVTDPSPYENHYNAGFEVLFANVTDNENYRHDLGYWTILRGFEAVGNTFDNPELWK